MDTQLEYGVGTAVFLLEHAAEKITPDDADREFGEVTKENFWRMWPAIKEWADVLWQVLEGPAEWIGTKVSFDLKQDGDFTIVLFKHQGWKEPVEFMHHCSTKWAIFLMSLKSLVETGKGAPDPNDVKIDNRN